MIDRALEAIVGRREHRPIPLHALMPNRVREILLVSSMYDSFTFEEDGRLQESLISDYLELNLRYAPRIERVSTADDALTKLRGQKFDLVISMPRVGEMDVRRFGEAVSGIEPHIPVVLLAYNTRELPILQAMEPLAGISRIFVWHGDVRLFLAIIKHVEDEFNAWHDAKIAGVQCILLVEDSPQFYSSYLPMLYTELVVQTQRLMADGLNSVQKFVRMRARPKILLATTFEEGLEKFERYREYLLGVILDAGFPRGGKLEPEAGLDFARLIRSESPEQPVLIQSSEMGHLKFAESINAGFIDKNSRSLMHDVRYFMQDQLGFGDFVFRHPDGEVVAVATDMRELAEGIATVPDDSLIYHASRNHFSSWLMARTEFDLARDLRPQRVEYFKSVDEIRAYLIAALHSHLDTLRAGVVAEFTSRTFDASSRYVRIGSGSLGGKGRGLAFINSLMNSYRIEDHIEGVHIMVPPTTVLATGVFDRFMEESGLGEIVFGDAGDERITKAFLEAELPEDVRESLRTFLSRVHYPLAVRSSSLLEDASYQPFAGVYRTCMIPNRLDNPDARLHELCNAIKTVYASTFGSASKTYIESTPNRLEEEKMAVIIQEVMGRTHGDYLYPDIAGVARSHDYYPMEGMRPEDGFASVALGLGITVVEGGASLRFSPAHPERLYQFSTVENYLENAQRDFLALNLASYGPCWGRISGQDANIVRLGLDVAEKHGVLGALASTYSPDSNAVYDGISRPGIRLVTMAGVLKGDVFPLAHTLAFLLKIGTVGFSCPVEIEFAVNLKPKKEGPHEFGFLQIRPVVSGAEGYEINIRTIEPSDAICVSHSALGHGYFEGIRDIIYVPDGKYDSGKTPEIAQEISRLNESMRQSRRPYILAGPGRWGSTDQWAGIPVAWSDISNAQCIIENEIPGMNIPPSQGTHFFHNITSLGIAYLTVSARAEGDIFDQDWLDNQPSKDHGSYARRVSFDEPLEVAINSRKRYGVVMKPGKGIIKSGLS